MNPKEWMRNVPDQDRLDEIYKDGGNEGGHYYWYLHSPEFRDRFLKPLGWICSSLGTRVLDVGCGEGWLADHVSIPYFGLDLSKIAIARANELRSRTGRGQFHQRALEDLPWDGCPRASVVVFGGILEVMVKPEFRSDLINAYQQMTESNYTLVYDLERLQMGSIEDHELISEYHAEAYPGIQTSRLETEKARRKILVYRYIGETNP